MFKYDPVKYNDSIAEITSNKDKSKYFDKTSTKFNSCKTRISFNTLTHEVTEKIVELKEKLKERETEINKLRDELTKVRKEVNKLKIENKKYKDLFKLIDTHKLHDFIESKEQGKLFITSEEIISPQDTTASKDITTKQIPKILKISSQHFGIKF